MTTPQPPLQGIRVLDLTWVLAGPFATMMLADLGAEVIKVEPPQGDMARQIPPHAFHGDSSFFLSVNRNKKSITLDLKSERGQQALWELVRSSDVVYSNFSPSATRAMGLTYDQLKEINPSIVVSTIHGFHDEPPFDAMPAFDSVIQAMGGAMSITGPEGEPGVRVGYQIGDLAGGLYSALGTVAALADRARSGQGRAVSVSLYDCQLSLLTWQAQNYLLSGEVPKPLGTKHPMIVPNQAFVTSDGKSVVVSPTGEKFWAKFCQAIERPELASDPKFCSGKLRHENRAELDKELDEVFAQKTRDEWMSQLSAAQVPAAPVQDVAEALAHPVTALRNMVVEAPHVLGGSLRMVGNPIKTGHEEVFTAPPPLGYHNAEYLEGE